ncbi:alpha-(1,3)-fucosyltransferase 7 [Misgurnus anguillicaudatus]|uniref:alpha-(1,3)-fucosyltransferase 7 n=1 Tax=Misgurnus anguillicaudatus TaxID=75329 RepID=UPI003CCF7876
MTRPLPLTLLILFMIISLIYGWLFMLNEQNHHFSNGSLKTNITILLWHWPFGIQYSLAGDVCLKDYGIAGCHLIDNRSLMESANLVVFHNAELKYRKEHLPLDLPRPASQRWVWLSLEAYNGNLAAYKNLFNLTMSYHPQADITVPYGKLIVKERPSQDFVIPKNKSHEVCWVVSNYQKWQSRSAVYQKLRQNINVQVYGYFVKRPLRMAALLPTISQCYFYLAFENTESRHYITEKLWRNAFLAGAVPVVLGPPRGDYEEVAPPKSFIHVNDFNSTEELAKYLRSLTKDPEKYNAYFTWRQNYTVKLYTDWRERLCNICPLYERFPIKKIYKDLGTWTKW